MQHHAWYLQFLQFCFSLFLIDSRSEWIYWEILSLMIGTLGLNQLSVHAISTQIMTITFMIPLGICEAMEIRIANVLPRSSNRAKKLSFYYSLCSTILFASMSYGIYIIRFWFYRIFTIELEVIDGCEEIWGDVCIFIFNIGVLEVNSGIATALGMQWMMGFFTVVFLWCTRLPALFYFAIYQDGGLKMAWQCIWPFYIALNIAIITRLVCCDWEAIAMDIRKDKGTKTDSYDKIDKSLDLSETTMDDSNDEVDEEEAKVACLLVSNTDELKMDENGTTPFGTVLKQHPKQC
jgi:Na+-driven multidrug efflux pump